MTFTPRVMVVGSINEDEVLRVDTLPRPGETGTTPSATTSSGRKGANQAVAAARAGAETRLLGALGNDARAARLQAQLHSHGVDTTTVDRVLGASGGAVVVVDRHGDNCIVVRS